MKQASEGLGMNVKRYVAADMRQALKQIRDELGPDAIILSNRRIEGGVEILTTQEADNEAWQPATAHAGDAGVLYSPAGQTTKADPALQQAARPDAVAISDADAIQASGAAARQAPDATFEYFLNRYRQPQTAPQDELVSAMRSEIENLRLLLKDQMSQASAERWSQSNPLQAAVARRLQDQGLSDTLAQRFARHGESRMSLEQAWQSALSRLAQAIPVSSHDPLDRPGIVALLGATGAGKSTTLAKLAIRYVLKHGRDQLALVSTDHYRLAAYEQLRILGRILDVPVRLVDEQHSLKDTLASLKHKSLILIDTAGFHPNDAERAAQIDQFHAVEQPIKKLLVLPSTSQRNVLQGICEQLEPLGLEGCVLSKVDEAASLGEVLSLVVEKQLSVTYITDGQRIPEDLGRACGDKLVAQLNAGQPLAEVAAAEAGQTEALFAGVPYQ